MKKRSDGAYGYERRRKWLRGGRIDLSLGRNRAEAKRRESALDLLLERKDAELIEAVRTGRVDVADLANAVRAENLDAELAKLRATLTPEAEKREPVAARMPDLSLAAMLDRVCAIKAGSKERGTALVYERFRRHLLASLNGSRPVYDFSTDELRTWLYAPRLAGKAWAPNTQASAHMVAAYTWSEAIRIEAEAAERHGFAPRITRSPWANIDPATARQTRHSFLEPAEWRTVLERAWGTPRAALVALGCLGGLRAMEAANLRTGLDTLLDGDAPVLAIQPRAGEFAWKPKHDHSIRDVPIIPALLEILTEHVNRGFDGRRYFIRSGRTDTPLSYSSARLWTVESFEAAGLRYGREGEALTNHSLRHTFASWLARDGVASRDIAALMGNTAEEVDRTYAHLFPSDRRRQALRIENILRGEK